MKVSEKQLQMLYMIAVETLRPRTKELFSIGSKQRHQLVNDILNQQSEEPVDISDEKPEELEVEK